MYNWIMHLFNASVLIQTVGIIGVTAIVFAESGLFFGFIFPGDSLLFTAGLLASQGYSHIIWYLALCFIAAVLGDNAGYLTGRKAGPMLFAKEDSFLFKKEYLTKTEEFFKKYGKKSLIMARFMPIVRTFTPIFAGAGKMDYRDFFVYNLIGGFVWTWSMLLAGYFLGTFIPGIEKYLSIIIVAIIAVSFIPSVIEFIKYKTRKDK